MQLSTFSGQNHSVDNVNHHGLNQRNDFWCMWFKDIVDLPQGVDVTQRNGELSSGNGRCITLTDTFFRCKLYLPIKSFQQNKKASNSY